MPGGAGAGGCSRTPRSSSLKALTTFFWSGAPFPAGAGAQRRALDQRLQSHQRGRTEAALNGLHVDGTLHLLLGGDGKSADFSSLKPYLAGDNIRLYCFGRDGSELAELRPEVPSKPKPWNRRCG